MKTYYRQILITGLFLVSIIFTSLGQEKTVKGVVTTFGSVRLGNATVIVRSTNQEAKTDSLGRFTVTCQPNDKLKVTATGFYTQRVKIRPKIKMALINVKLMPIPENKEIAVGYGHVRNANRINAISSLDDNDLPFSQYTSIYELITGRFPGVQIEDGNIIIRGKVSITGDGAALIIIDGIVSDKSALKNISPMDIKSIDILKDDAAAIYGTLGAPGVVLIATKRGDS